MQVMKNTILIAFVVCLLAVGCSKEAEVPTVYRQFAGTWEEEQFIGFPGTVTLPPGNGRLLVLGADGIMESRRKDTVLYRGRYYLQQKADCRPAGKQPVLYHQRQQLPVGRLHTTDRWQAMTLLSRRDRLPVVKIAAIVARSQTL